MHCKPNRLQITGRVIMVARAILLKAHTVVTVVIISKSELHLTASTFYQKLQIQLSAITGELL